jgi:integrase
MTGRRSSGEGTVYRRKDGRWEGSAWLLVSDGRRKRVSLYRRTQREARQALAELIGRTDQGVPVPVHTWRVGAYLDHWMETAPLTRAATTRLTYAGIINNYLKPGLGNRVLTRLSVAEVQSYLDRQLDAGTSIRTVQKIRTVLSAALTNAQREDLLARNVARHVRLPIWRRKDIRPWTTEQLATFLRVAEPEPLHAAFVLLSLYGLRCGEVLGIQWEDIDVAGGRIRIRQQLQRYDGDFHLVATKTFAGTRDLPLLDTVRQALHAHAARTARPTGLIFQTRFDSPVESGNLRRAFQRVSRQAGLPRITLHHLRHTTATLLKNLGVPTRDAQLILGHATVVTTEQLYQHADLTGQLNALTRLETSVRPTITVSRQIKPSTVSRSLRRRRLTPGRPRPKRPWDTGSEDSASDGRAVSLTEALVLVRSSATRTLLGSAAVSGAVKHKGLRDSWSRSKRWLRLSGTGPDQRAA